MAKELLYYKLNVKYPVSVRRHPMDNQGVVLSLNNPHIVFEADSLRDFKVANKYAILEGLIVPSEAPDIDWETPNALTDEDITELLKNYLKLKNALNGIDSLSILNKILQAAKEQDKSDKIKKLIINRIEELTGSEFVDSKEMQGVV